MTGGHVVRVADDLWADVAEVSALAGRPAAETVRLALVAYLEALPGGRAGLAARRARS